MGPGYVLRLIMTDTVNRVLSSLIRITMPTEWSGIATSEWPSRKVLFSSWTLLFGLFPADRHRFFFQRIDPRQGFVESSTSLTNKRWHQRRDMSWGDDVCVVTETVDFEPRLSFLAGILTPVHRFAFEHLHTRLRRLFRDN
ncbi:MAG: hypothetical protein Cons2KO_17890 [Congregibacter sp.]